MARVVGVVVQPRSPPTPSPPVPGAPVPLEALPPAPPLPALEAALATLATLATLDDAAVAPRCSRLPARSTKAERAPQVAHASASPSRARRCGEGRGSIAPLDASRRARSPSRDDRRACTDP